MIGLAIVSVFLRVALRLKMLRTIFLDYGFLAVALLCNIAIGVIVRCSASDLYEQESVQYFGKEPPLDYQNVLHNYATKQRAIWFLLLTSLWSIKASFVLVFAKLTDDTRWIRWTWWATSVLIALSYIGCLISYPLSNRYNKMVEGTLILSDLHKPRRMLIWKSQVMSKETGPCIAATTSPSICFLTHCVSNTR